MRCWRGLDRGGRGGGREGRAVLDLGWCWCWGFSCLLLPLLRWEVSPLAGADPRFSAFFISFFATIIPLVGQGEEGLLPRE